MTVKGETCGDDDGVFDVVEVFGLMSLTEAALHDERALKTCAARRARARRLRLSVYIVLSVLGVSAGIYALGYEMQFYLTAFAVFARVVWGQYLRGRFGLVAVEGLALIAAVIVCAGVSVAFADTYKKVTDERVHYLKTNATCTVDYRVSASAVGDKSCEIADKHLGRSVIAIVISKLYERGFLSMFFNGSPTDLYVFVASGAGVGVPGWIFSLALLSIVLIVLTQGAVGLLGAVIARRAAEAKPPAVEPPKEAPPPVVKA